MIQGKKISIVIPVYNVGDQIIGLIEKIPSFVDQIYVVDDKCPMNTGKKCEKLNHNNNKIKVLYNEKNLGVGGAVKFGYQESVKNNCELIVKIDGDNQMNPNEIKKLVDRLLTGYDYVKGNRFLNKTEIINYPPVRFYGNIFLSFLSKLSTGYWNIFDTVNGFTCIKAKIVNKINLNEVDNGYFFETDLLFNLNLIKCRVADVPVTIKYFKDRKQNMSISKETIRFFYKNISRIKRRIIYQYFSNNFTIGSFFGITSFFLFLFSIFFGGYNWIKYGIILKLLAPTGIVILSFTSLIISILFLGVFLFIDSQNDPNNFND
jgi:dolichol-phosphate mannosyltransferase